VKTADILKSYLDRTLEANEAQEMLKVKASRTADCVLEMIQIDRNARRILEEFRAPDGAEDRIVKLTEMQDLPAVASSKRTMRATLLDFLPKPFSEIQPEVVGAGTVDSDKDEAKDDDGSIRRDDVS
jgi:FixJ family two-component response regulator